MAFPAYTWSVLGAKKLFVRKYRPTSDYVISTSRNKKVQLQFGELLIGCTQKLWNCPLSTLAPHSEPSERLRFAIPIH